MLEIDKKQQLLDQFSTYLDAASNEENETDTTTLQADDSKIDLYRLFLELAALKSEVKIESRQVKKAIEGFQVLTDLLQKNNDQLNKELDERRQQEFAHQENIEKPLLLAFLDIRDRMEAGMAQMEKYQPAWFTRRDKDTLEHLQTLHEGMNISMRRLDVLLDRYHVKPIGAVGQQLDPHTMQVSGTEVIVDQSEGTILAETRKGYLRKGQLMRLSEVTVNKLNRETS